MPDKKTQKKKLYILNFKSSTSIFKNNHFNVRDAGNFTVLYWSAFLRVKLLQMIENLSCCFPYAFSKIVLLSRLLCAELLSKFTVCFRWNVFDDLLIDTSIWSLMVFICNPNWKQNMFFLSFLFLCLHKPGVCTGTVKVTVAMWKTPNIHPFPCLFTVWKPCRKRGCSRINDATRVSKFL